MPSRACARKAAEKPAPKTKAKEAEKPAKQKPEVHVTEGSSPEDILHSSWEFLSVCQFFNTFRSFFQLSSSFSIEKLELGLLNESDRSVRESSILSQTSNHSDYLIDFIIRIIAPLFPSTQKSRINADSYQDYLMKLFPNSRALFTELTLMEKIKLLKQIEDIYMETDNERFISLKNEKTSENLRVEPLGTDYQGWTYWNFGDTRLYREIPIPNGKRGTDMINKTDFTFQLACSTAEEWHEIVKAFQPSNRAAGKELATKITELGQQVISQLEAREAARLKNEARLKKAKELELIPKKRSRRLEAKFEEDSKRQKTLEIERQRLELETIERKKKQQEEKLAAEKEKKDVRVEEARIRNEIHEYILKLISNRFETELNLRELKNQLSKRATVSDRLVKMQGWVGLLTDKISIEFNEENNLYFTGDNLDEVLSYDLMKNTLRVYLLTIMKYKLETESKVYSDFNEIYKKLLLNRYEDIHAFSLDLNNTLNEVNEDIKEYSHDLLKAVFNPEFNKFNFNHLNTYPKSREFSIEGHESREISVEDHETSLENQPIDLQNSQTIHHQYDQINIENSIVNVDNHESHINPSNTNSIQQDSPLVDVSISQSKLDTTTL